MEGGGGGGKRIGKEGEQKRKEKLRVRATETQRKNKRGQRARNEARERKLHDDARKNCVRATDVCVHVYTQETGIRVEPIVRYMHVKSANSQREKRGALTQRKVDGGCSARRARGRNGERKHGERRERGHRRGTPICLVLRGGHAASPLRSENGGIFCIRAEKRVLGGGATRRPTSRKPIHSRRHVARRPDREMQTLRYATE